MAERKNANLPGVQTLFQDSWELFQKTFLPYLKVIGLGVAFLFLGALIGILISLPVTVLTIGNHFQILRHLTPFYVSILVLLGMWALLYFLSIFAIGIIFPIVSIFILEEGKSVSLVALIKQSKHLFLPYFLTMLLSVLLVFGGMALFVIPGIVIAILFSFVAYEVVLDKQSGVGALQRSYLMIKQYFWQVVGRVLLLELGMWIASAALQRIVMGNFVMGIAQVLFSIAFTWYFRAYLFVLYKQVRAKTTFPQHISLQWIWIVSIIGWVVFVLLVAGLVTVVPGMMQQQHPRIPNGAV